MLPVSLRHAATPSASPQAAPVEAAAPAQTSLSHPDGLTTRGSTHGDMAPRTTLASLPADVHRHVSQYLDAQSVVAFAATSKAHRALMTELPGFGQIGQLYPAVKSAQTAADFEQAFAAIGANQDSRFRTEALETLALRFLNTHATMPPLQALDAREALVGALQNTPPSPGSGRALAAATHAAFETVRHMTRTAHQLTVDPGNVAPQDQLRMLQECEAVLEAATRDHFALNDVVNAHGLVTQRDTMARLVDESFGEASTPLVMQFASIMVPLRLAKLEAGSVAPEHVVGLLTHLAEAEARPSNLAALHEMEWAAMAAGKIVAALDAHGIDAAAHPALHAALRTLTGPAA
jgi:hypothetical protein